MNPSVKIRQQIFHDEQWVMFTIDPHEKMMLGQVLYPGNPNNPPDDITNEDWLIVCGLYTDHETFCHLNEAVYIRPPTEKEIFLGKLSGMIHEDD